MLNQWKNAGLSFPVVCATSAKTVNMCLKQPLRGVKLGESVLELSVYDYKAGFDPNMGPNSRLFHHVLVNVVSPDFYKEEQRASMDIMRDMSAEQRKEAGV